MKYIIGIDQSTQGTKAILFDREGAIIKRADVPHRQIVNDQGWVSHDPEEIYHNVIRVVRMAVEEAGISKEEILAVGISNQRETTVCWDQDGKPLHEAVVWQCNRAWYIAERLQEHAAEIYEKTGLPLSAYFPAAKMAWLMEHAVPKAPQGTKLHLGTVDSWLVYRLTGNKEFRTDYSNASRTQLFDLHKLAWDKELCDLFCVPVDALPQVCDSDSCFGYTDFEGYLEKKIPIMAVLGDSHGALFGQGCHENGMVKATYGTGSSVMMNIGSEFVLSRNGLATSLAWGLGGKVDYVLEGNINYTGAVITWLKEDMGLIGSPKETEGLAMQANPVDTAILVPAFTGLSAPYWKGDARALLSGMSRTTGRAEIVRAALDSIAFQITDVLKAMAQDSECRLKNLRVDGGPTGNAYLMQVQSDLADVTVNVSGQEELSAIGAAYLAGISSGLYQKEKLFSSLKYRQYEPAMANETRAEKYAAWKRAVEMTFARA